MRDLRPTWECIEVDGTVGFRSIDKCSKTAPLGLTCCSGCYEVRNLLFRSCRKEVKAIDDEGGPGGSYESMMLRSPILLKNRMKSQSRSIRLLQKEEKRKRDTISRLRATTEVIPNINADTILGDVKNGREHMTK